MNVFYTPLYLFWFLHQTTTTNLSSQSLVSCISFDSYIKPQPAAAFSATFCVVSLLIPTSNHNLPPHACVPLLLYLFWFLHQTTTNEDTEAYQVGCISFDSYIKPQPRCHLWPLGSVVSLLIPTSNHNSKVCGTSYTKLYLFWFLHQTTTNLVNKIGIVSCISFDSYIKPQLNMMAHGMDGVVSLLIPTSNHNSERFRFRERELYLFWFLHQTTTSRSLSNSALALYLFWFLHQTTTVIEISSTTIRCISFDSYIKPQLLSCS